MTALPQRANWAPQSEVVDLVGNPLSPTSDFNVPPPAEIGKIVAAWTPARTDKPRKPLWLRLMTMILVPVIFYLTGDWLIGMINSNSERQSCQITLWVTLIVLVIPLSIYLALNRVHNYIWYVGEEGVARAKVDRPDKPLDVIRFADVGGLRTGLTRHYHNGIYCGTHYHHTWFGLDGNVLFKQKGTFFRKKRVHRTNNAFRFGALGEGLWNAHFSARASDELARTGAVTFPVNRNDYVRISPMRLEFFMRGESVIIDKADIEGIYLRNGTFTVRHKDATWYGRAGKYSFQYAAMSNAQMFLFALEKLVGYRFA